VVGYDSIIHPGREGKITPEVNIKGMTGNFHKTIRVLSNAQNKPAVALRMKGTVINFIQVENNYIRMQRGESNSKLVKNTWLKATVDNLKIKKVSFKPYSRKGPQWHNNLPFFIDFELNKRDTAKEGVYYTYDLTLSMPNTDEDPMAGYFVFETNHNKKREYKVRGMIDGRK
jgi:hypothetical protein